MTRIAVIGAAGRMGKVLVQAVHTASGVELGAAIVSPNSSLLGADAGELASIGKVDVRLKASLADAADDFEGMPEVGGDVLVTAVAAIAQLGFFAVVAVAKLRRACAPLAVIEQACVPFRALV